MIKIDPETSRYLSIILGISRGMIETIGAAFLLTKVKQRGGKQTAKELGSKRASQQQLKSIQRGFGIGEYIFPDAEDRFQEDTNPYAEGDVQTPQRKNVYGNSSWVGEIAYFPQKGSKRGVIWISTREGGKKYVFPDRTFGQYQALADPTLSPSPKPTPPAKSLKGMGKGVGTQLWRLGFLGGSPRYDQEAETAALAQSFRMAKTKAELRALSVIQNQMGRRYF